MPGAPYAGAWRTKHCILTTNYEPKSRSRRTGDQFDEKTVIVRGALELAKNADSPFMRAYYRRVAERYLSSQGELKSLKRQDDETGTPRPAIRG